MARLRKPFIPEGPIRLYYERMHAMHHAAGQPSVRQMQRDTRGPRWPNGINPTTIHDAFVKPRLARWEIVHEIARRLGGDVKELAALWRRAREAQLTHHGEAADIDFEGAEFAGETEARPGTREETATGTRTATTHTIPRELPPDVFGFTGRAEHLK